MRIYIWCTFQKLNIETNSSENVIFENYKYPDPGPVPKRRPGSLFGVSVSKLFTLLITCLLKTMELHDIVHFLFRAFSECWN